MEDKLSSPHDLGGRRGRRSCGGSDGSDDGDCCRRRDRQSTSAPGDSSTGIDGSLMPFHRLSPADFTTLENPGKRSEQIVWPENAPEARVTITRVTIDPGTTSVRHSHAAAEQTWLVERGRGTLLLGDGGSHEVQAGDVIITPSGEVHGVTNTGDEEFVYLSVTTPPEDFTRSYQRRL